MPPHTPAHRRLFLDGPAGRLEALLWVSPLATRGAARRLVAVVCHPHPLFGGTMHNKVVFRVARTLDKLGVPVLRFNFRSAGLSAGKHDRGRGEADDIAAALDFMAGEFPGRALLLAGFSFGAWVGMRVGCADARVAELVGLGLPVDDSDFSYLAACPKPKLFLQGDGDQFGARKKLEALLARLPKSQREQTTLVFVPAADHFFTGRLDRVDAALRTWLLARYGSP
ncbi:MAG: alpha/beta hydrolase [Acidobacteria bacterium]|nr:alpha/beta hydrolase [Acidobacteriota bacterium]